MAEEEGGTKEGALDLTDVRLYLGETDTTPSQVRTGTCLLDLRSVTRHIVHSTTPRVRESPDSRTRDPKTG